jgi:DNA-binding CsgD family transcriptional regulator
MSRARTEPRVAASTAKPTRAKQVQRLDERAILALHDNVEIEGYWRSASELLSGACAFGQAALYVQAMPGEAPSAWFAHEQPSFDAGALFDDLESDGSDSVRALDSSELRRVTDDKRWAFGVAMALEGTGYHRAAIVLFRTKSAARFTAGELEMLRRLQPHFATGIRNVRAIKREHVTRLALQRLLSRLPIGILLLDWDGSPLFHNTAANELCAVWNFGAESARVLSPARVFRVPKEIRVATHSMYATSALGAPERERVLESTRALGLRATINFVRFDAQTPSRPRFLIHFEREPSLRRHRETRHLSSMVKLSPREREVLERICRGESNAQIASGLGKSVLTVKKQLQSIFRKMRVTSRTQLVAKFG